MDLIDRQAAIKAIMSEPADAHYPSWYADIVYNLPSAESVRMKGKWMKAYGDHEAFGVRPFFRYCSECHESTVYPYNFCPNCGADMRGEHD